MNTFSAFCMAACVFMIFVGMASIMVNSIGAFPGESVPNIDTTTSQSKFAVDYTNILSSVAIYGVAIVAAIAAAFLTRTTNLAGIWIFDAIFWSGWLSMIPIFDAGGFLLNVTGGIIISMLTVGMDIMFIGAVVGMLTGSHQMK